MHDLRDFHLSDMVRLDAGLRSGGQGAASMEAAARSVVTHLADRLIDKESGEKSCVLARLFVTLPLGSLEPALQDVARAALPPGLTGPDAESVRCLTLLATVGDESDWCSRRSSRGHQVVPLPNEAAIERSPMIAEAFDLTQRCSSIAAAPCLSTSIDRASRSLSACRRQFALGRYIIELPPEKLTGGEVGQRFTDWLARRYARRERAGTR